MFPADATVNLGLAPDRQQLHHARAAIARRARQYPPSILIACMPKSGSTYLANALAAATGYPMHPLVYIHERNEQDLYLPELLRTLNQPIVTQQHVRATLGNLELIQLFHLRPVILVRNLFDVVVSLYDHLHHDDFRVPMANVTPEFFELSEKRKLDAIIDLHLPWYFSFFTSWATPQPSLPCLVHWVTYEALQASPHTTVQGILAFANQTLTMDQVERAIALARQSKTRFNQGKTGRGQEILSREQQQRILEYIDYYPSVDFSLIGLSRTHAAAVTPL